MSVGNALSAAIERMTDMEGDDVLLPKDEVAALLRERDALVDGIRMIHQALKRGEATKDHGPAGNLKCILDHISDIPSAL